MPRSSTILSLMSSSMCWNILWAWRGVARAQVRPEISSRTKPRTMADRTRTYSTGKSEDNKRVTRDKTGDRKDIEDTAG